MGGLQGFAIIIGLTNKVGGKYVSRYADSLKKFIKRIGCNSFAKDTLVTTNKGLVKIIQDIQVGDLVLTRNEDSGEHEYKPVIHLIHNEEMKKALLIKLSNGKVINATPGHLIFVGGEWISAEKIRSGGSIYSLDKKVVVESVSISREKVSVYNFTVEGNHNYFVGKNGVLVHNISPCEKATKELVKLVSRGYCDMNFCKQFTESLEDLLVKNKVQGGKRLCLRSAMGGIWSDSKNANIATGDGNHVAIQVGDLVFDNLNPDGVSYNKWLNNLGGNDFIGITPGKAMWLTSEKFGSKSDCLNN